MTPKQATPAEPEAAVAADARVLSREAAGVLTRGFGVEFDVVDGQSGELLSSSPEQPRRDWSVRGELCREVARRNRYELMDVEDPFVVLAMPLPAKQETARVAVGTFVTRPVDPGEDVSAAARLLDLVPEEATTWASQQEPWSMRTLERTAELVVSQLAAERRIEDLLAETESLSQHLASTYEEISLLHRLTQNLRISEREEDLAKVALGWLHEVLPATGVAAYLMPVAKEDEAVAGPVRTKPVMLVFGRCPVDAGEFGKLVETLKLRTATRPVVANLPVTRRSDWPCPAVRQIIAVPLMEGANLFGWLAAVNHVDDAEFGSVEANLLHSVSAILGIHSGNIELYRQQSELVTGIVRVLGSAIDAKDPYTRGHSDRVARIAVRLAAELGCDVELQEMIYLSGLLHDIGKIGIDDSVLRKPGKLSDEEYEHIKLHVQIGHKILVDLKKLDEVLPVVLHHHETWDGRGYPRQLHSEQIPLSARIVAVADAYDAMGSDRPYRQELSDEQIDEIFRSGSGRQWDPAVVEAFFRARDDIRKLAKHDVQDIVPLGWAGTR